MSKVNYSDNQINEFLDVAQEIGIGRAMRKLGYPQAWGTAQRWAQLRGVTVAVDELKARSKEFHDWYETEEILITAQAGIQRVYEELTMNPNLLPDDQKKLAEALTKHYNVWANIQGKATSISESRETDTFTADIEALIESERRRNDAMSLKPENDVTQSNSE